MKKNAAVVIFSGGQDSTTCLAWAMKKFNEIHAITFDYGQRHKKELQSARKIAKLTGIPLKIQKINLFKGLTQDALLNHKAKITGGDEKNLPSTFVPGRNLIFISTAAIFAKQLNIPNLITGVCQTDYSGYPDCRQPFITSLQKTLQLAMESPFKIHTPLMNLTKAQTVEMMDKLGELALLKHSHTCYKGMRPACGKCPSCELRLKGFKEAGLNDPLKYV